MAVGNATAGTKAQRCLRWQQYSSKGCSFPTGIGQAPGEPARGRPSLELIGSLFADKYQVFHRDIFCSKTELGAHDARLVAKPLLKTRAG